MQLEDYFDFLAGDDIRIKGHRIGIESVLYEYIHRAQTPEEIADRYPTLSLEQIHATILYYLRNQAEVDSYVAAWLAHGEAMRDLQGRSASPQLVRLREAAAGYAVTSHASPDTRHEA